jgi:hypothetical protein
MSIVNFDRKGERSAGAALERFFDACARIVETANDSLVADDREAARDILHDIEEALTEARVALRRR